MPATQSQLKISEALRALSRVCDGAHSVDGSGFSKFDSDFGMSLADRRPEYLTAKQLTAGYKLCRKYRVQLGRLGFPFEAIPDPDLPTNPPPAVVADLGQLGLSELPHEEALELATEMLGYQPAPERIAVYDALPGEQRSVAVAELDAYVADTQTVATLTVDEVLGPDGIIAKKLPGYESRPQQLAMARLVAESIDRDNHAVIEAGTGTGKSLGYLVPAILSGKRTIVSTADKALQTQIWLKDIPFLQSVMPQPFTAALLKGRGNYLCLYHLDKAREQYEGTLEGFGSQTASAVWPQIVNWAEQEAANNGSGDLESAPFQIPAELHEAVTADSDSCVGKKCPFYAPCYAEKARRTAELAKVIVVNHALLMRDLELRYETDGHATVLPDPECIILDEAHHLEDQATDAFGVEVSRGSFTRIENRLERLTTKGTTDEKSNWGLRLATISGNLDSFYAQLQDRMIKQRVSTVRLGDEQALIDPSLKGLNDLRSALRESMPAYLEGAERDSWTKLGESVGKLAEGLGRCTIPDPNMATVRYAEKTGEGRRARLVLKAKPVEVADELRARLWTMTTGEGECIPVIATSATIADQNGMGYWRGRTGCDEASDLEVGSPFDYAHNALLYLPMDGKGFVPQYGQEESVEYTARLAEEIERLILASNGRAFVLFTSNKQMNAVYERLSPRLKAFLVLKQGGGESRPELVRLFREHGNAVLFGVKSFWEGVDVQGEALSLVIIDKLPFIPPEDPVFEARKDAITRRTGDNWAWWNQMAIPNVVIALKQGFGRLIRTKSDRGVVAILDGRMTTKNYGQAIIKALPAATQTRSQDAVRTFFA